MFVEPGTQRSSSVGAACRIGLSPARARHHSPPALTCSLSRFHTGTLPACILYSAKFSFESLELRVIWIGANRILDNRQGLADAAL